MQKHRITYVKEQLYHCIYRLQKPQRNKRGLINALGSIMKAITGNLDNNDLVNIDKKFSITTDIMDNITKRIQNVSEYINIFVNQFNENTSRETIVNELLFSLESLKDMCYRITESYVFAQHDILHPSIIDQLHLMDSLKQIPASINVLKDPLKLEAQITPHVIIESNIMIFQLPIPIISKDFYYLEYLLPIINKVDENCYIPNLMPGHYLIRNNQVYKAKECKQRICTIDVTDDCIKRSIFKQKNECKQLLVFCPATYSRKINNNLYYQYTNKEKSIEDRCTSERNSLLGSYLEDNTECFQQDAKTELQVYQMDESLATEIMNNYPISLPNSNEEVQEQIKLLRRYELVDNKVETLYTESYITAGLITTLITVFCVLRKKIRRYSTLGEERKAHGKAVDNVKPSSLEEGTRDNTCDTIIHYD
ncbi:unnamed protein product [Chilo suppressalis]|uniref:Envelope fusion protein n=1 Tax=Chilo suppressalis TaxID=168631 RepID=A0ABN8AQ77_CHISP|nr:unnamed protein product [Chilo suppressalis]